MLVCADNSALVWIVNWKADRVGASDHLAARNCFPFTPLMESPARHHSSLVIIALIVLRTFFQNARFPNGRMCFHHSGDLVPDFLSARATIPPRSLFE